MVEIMETLGSDVFKQMFADSPRLVAFLDAEFSGPANDAARHRLLESVDESQFSLRDWVESLRTVQAWLDSRGLELPIEDQIGYVGCAGDAASAGANLTHLPALVADMLETYGCERAEKRNS